MSSRIFYYQNQSVVQKARKEFSFSHVKAKQDQECGSKVCRNTKGSASCSSHVKAKQGLFFSRQSKARRRQAVIAKWQTKQWCKKGKISARQRSKKQVLRSVPRVSRVEGLTLREAPRYRFTLCGGALCNPALPQLLILVLCRVLCLVVLCCCLLSRLMYHLSGPALCFGGVLASCSLLWCCHMLLVMLLAVVRCCFLRCFHWCCAAAYCTVLFGAVLHNVALRSGWCCAAVNCSARFLLSNAGFCPLSLCCFCCHLLLCIAVFYVVFVGALWCHGPLCRSPWCLL